MNPLEYVLNLVAEEATEVAGAAHKALRFGLDDLDPATGISNKDQLVKEWNDLRATLRMLEEQLAEVGDSLTGLDDEAAIEAKIQKVLKWSRRSVANGTLVETIKDSAGGVPLAGP